MIYVPTFMTIGSSIQVILVGGIIKTAVEMISGGMIYVTSFIMIGLGIQLILRLLSQQEAAVLVQLMGGIYEVCIG
jgi:hypothetical protein